MGNFPGDESRELNKSVDLREVHCLLDVRRSSIFENDVTMLESHKRSRFQKGRIQGNSVRLAGIARGETPERSPLRAIPYVHVSLRWETTCINAW